MKRILALALVFSAAQSFASGGGLSWKPESCNLIAKDLSVEQTPTVTHLLARKGFTIVSSAADGYELSILSTVGIGDRSDTISCSAKISMSTLPSGGFTETHSTQASYSCSGVMCTIIDTTSYSKCQLTALESAVDQLPSCK